jgi:hypothetical protein
MEESHVKVLIHAADTVSALAILAAFAGFLPPLAAFGAFCWYALQIWESRTATAWRRRRHIRAIRRRRKAHHKAA